MVRSVLLSLILLFSTNIYATGPLPPCAPGQNNLDPDTYIPVCSNSVPQANSSSPVLTPQQIAHGQSVYNAARANSNLSEGEFRQSFYNSGVSECMANNNPRDFCEQSMMTMMGGEGEISGALNGRSGGSTAEDKKIGEQCAAAYTKANSMCKGSVLMEKGAEIGQLGTMLAQSQSMGNTKKSCEMAGKINAITGGLNAAVGTTCKISVGSCKKACDKSKLTTVTMATDTLNVGQAYAACVDLDAVATSQLLQVSQNALNVLGSKACADAASGECMGDNGYSNSECTQFCFKQANQQHPKCLNARNDCSSPNYAAQNVQYCTCLSNPLSPSCRTNVGTPIPGSGTAGAPNFDADGLGGGDYDFNGVNPEGKAASVNAGEGGGGGFNASGGSSAFGDSQGGGSGDEPINKEILTGTGGAAGGMGGVFGGGGYGDGGARGGGSKSDEKGIDLSAFLPGGKKDPTRNPASAGYGDPTITKANGLTNWQKVTRKMNEKRPELMP